MDILSAFFWLSLNCYHECRGEPELGKAYVTTVVLNRARKSNKTIKEIIFKPAQFSWTSSDKLSINEPLELLHCAESVRDSINMTINKKILYYHATYVHPSWADSLEPVMTIGNHIFYKEK